MTLAAAPIAPIGAHSMLVFLLQLGLLAVLALSLGRLVQRVGMPAIVGELLAGVLVGPSLLFHLAPGFSGWLFPHDPNQMHLLDAVGQIGVLLLVGITGMNIDLGHLRRQGRKAAGVSLGGLIVPLALGFLVGLALPDTLLPQGTDRTVFAGFIAIAMCVSAIPVIAKTLLEMRLLHRNIGQMIMNAAAVDDIVGWLLLSVVSALATTGVRAGEVTKSVAFLVVLLVLAFTVGRRVVDLTLKLSGRSKEPGVPVTAAALLMVLCAAATQAMGMEAIIGTFLAGILIGSSRYVDRVKIAPLRTFVLAVPAPIFFATAGLRMDLTGLAKPSVLLSAAIVLVIAIVGKFVGAYIGARAARMQKWEALALGAGLNARGVIEVIIAMAGLRLGVLTTEMYTIIVLVAIVTSVLAPPLLRFSASRITVTLEERKRERVLAA